jgi:hypothetical protein
VGTEVKAVIFGKGRGTPIRGIERRHVNELKSVLSDLPADTLIYLDVGGLTQAERSRLLRATLNKAGRRVGIIDPKGSVRDVAALFHAGAVDYIHTSAGAGALSLGRIAAVRSYASLVGAVPGDAPQAPVLPALAALKRLGSARIPGGGDSEWEGVEDGNEHNFAFLYVEVDDVDEMRKHYEPDSLSKAMETFREFVFKMVSPSGGRLWMWSRFSGLVLFPLRALDFPAPLCGLRILLSRVFFDAEESPLPGRLSFRMALSIGSTAYTVGDPGRILSEGINSIFHLGRRFARPGQFLFTWEASVLTPEPLRSCGCCSPPRQWACHRPEAHGQAGADEQGASSVCASGFTLHFAHAAGRRFSCTLRSCTGHRPDAL